MRPIKVERNNQMIMNGNEVLFSPTTGLPVAKPKGNLKNVEIYYVINPSVGSNDE